MDVVTLERSNATAANLRKTVAGLRAAGKKIQRVVLKGGGPGYRKRKTSYKRAGSLPGKVEVTSYKSGEYLGVKWDVPLWKRPAYIVPLFKSDDAEPPSKTRRRWAKPTRRNRILVYFL